MGITLNKETQEYVAKYFGDLSKAIISIGFASYFFKEMPLFWRIGCGILAIVFFISSVILMNVRKGE